MQFTGRDVAKFMTQMTGENFLKLYDKAEEEDSTLKTEAKNRFTSLMNRMNEVERKNNKDVID